MGIEADPELAVAAEREQRIETLRAAIEDQRKQAEDQGVIYEGMRFSGSPANRQYLSEALQFAQAVGVDTFDTWKDSDNRFHANVPVVTVTEAFRQIGQRRNALFEREQHYAQQIDAGELLSAEGLDWAL
ncbi:hypothetical protein BFW38_03400 [Terasakiispira papahanaumokuakeensis]|uniref:DUF4376 domain-containing protein n=1 Tax=Terasakiispira papahanaumokuakeensis TaxID=197479 RepID=A0A1E2VDU6_9GAMM|nr:hypothetical protein BFW38_03400 [Terasakiispira papahanaumokuakeensis]